MSTTYGGADSFPTLITIPSDGDLRNAASVNVPLQGIADRSIYLENRRPVDLFSTLIGNYTGGGAGVDTTVQTTTPTVIRTLSSMGNALTGDIIMVVAAVTLRVNNALTAGDINFHFETPSQTTSIRAGYTDINHADVLPKRYVATHFHTVTVDGALNISLEASGYAGTLGGGGFDTSTDFINIYEGGILWAVRWKKGNG